MRSRNLIFILKATLYVALKKGVKGIRTLGGKPTQPFQDCTIDHSDITP